MKKTTMAAILVCLLIVAALAGCQSNYTARVFGGTQTVNLEPDAKLVNVTWKDTELWILTRPMREGETAERYKFYEKNDSGIFEGTVNLIEHTSKP